MGDLRSIGPRALPPDAEIHKFLADLISECNESLFDVLHQLDDTMKETLSNKQPCEFAFAKLLNYLNDQDDPAIIYLCAAALFKLNDLGAQWNTDQNE